MELKEFIEETIKQVADGLVSGSTHIRDNYPRSEGVEAGYKKIKFDVAVTTNEEDKLEGGAKIKVAHLFDIGAKGEGSSKTTNYNRIEFETLIQVNTTNHK